MPFDVFFTDEMFENLRLVSRAVLGYWPSFSPTSGVFNIRCTLRILAFWDITPYSVVNRSRALQRKAVPTKRPYFLNPKQGVKSHIAKIPCIVGKHFSTNVHISFKSRDLYCYTKNFEVCWLKIIFIYLYSYIRCPLQVICFSSCCLIVSKRNSISYILF